MNEDDKDKLKWSIVCCIFAVAMCAPLVYALLVMSGVLPAPQ